MHLTTLFVYACVSLVAVNSSAQEFKLIATKDTSPSSYHTEKDRTRGESNTIKLKGIQEIGLIGFDFSSLKGKEIVKAELYMHNVRNERELHRLNLSLDRDNALRKIGISTIASKWNENNATFNEAYKGEIAWAWKGSRLWDVIMGNGYTLEQHTILEYTEDGWWKVPLPPEMIYALITEASDGLCIMDETGQILANNYVHSRESNYQPYIMVYALESEPVEVEAPKQFEVHAEPEHSTLSTGAAKISFVESKGAFSYRIKLNGKDVPRWQIPYAKQAGQHQSFVIRDLQPDTKLKLEIRAMSRTGELSKIVEATGHSSVELEIPSIAIPELKSASTKNELEIYSGKMKLWAFPEVSKIDPITGDLIGERFTGNYRLANCVWNADSNSVKLLAARGEIVAFQLAIQRLKGPLKNVRVEFSDLSGKTGIIQESKIKAYRNWYVRENGWQQEYAIPLLEGFSIPTEDNNLDGQKNQSLYIDLHIPKETEPGLYSGEIFVSADGVSKISLKLQVKIYDVVIPGELNFDPMLNYYGGLGKGGTERWFDMHRIAHAHRCTLTRVPYSQSGRVHYDLCPKITGTGENQRVVDWAEYDKNVGPLFDGTAFKDNPRKGIPVSDFYMPFHENWPNPIEDHYNYDGPKHGDGCLIQHALNSPLIENAFTREYEIGFQNIVRDFIDHFQEKGWEQTRFMVYFNNKDSYRKKGRGTSWWCLDEPRSYDDWTALRYFSNLFHGSTPEARKSNFLFRGDISRPEWQFMWMDGLMEMMVVNSSIFEKIRRCNIMKERMPTNLYAYGACNKIGKSNHQTTAWCLNAYVAGANGVVPWNSIAGDGALDEANQNGLIVDGKRFGHNVVCSLRVKALRRGAQDVELLRLLAKKKNWRREQIAAFIVQRIPISGEFHQEFIDEAAEVQYEDLKAKGFLELKRAVLER